jgi:hypothetical protein
VRLILGTALVIGGIALVNRRGSLRPSFGRSEAATSG